MNVLKMVFELRDKLEAEYNTLISQADALECLPDANGKKHAAALNARCETIINNLFMLAKAIKKYARINDRAGEETTFAALIERLQNDHRFAESLGWEMEIQKMAADNWTDTVGYELHEYGDGSLDPPILNHESYQRMKDKENER